MTKGTKKLILTRLNHGGRSPAPSVGDAVYFGAVVGLLGVVVVVTGGVVSVVAT